MEQTRLKHNVDGSVTVYVPKGQVNLFKWIIDEGELALTQAEGEIDENGFNDLGIKTNQLWLGFDTT